MKLPPPKGWPCRSVIATVCERASVRKRDKWFDGDAFGRRGRQLAFRMSRKSRTALLDAI